LLREHPPEMKKAVIAQTTKAGIPRYLCISGSVDGSASIVSRCILKINPVHISPPADILAGRLVEWHPVLEGIAGLAS